jgi:hypothetical protein
MSALHLIILLAVQEKYVSPNHIFNFFEAFSFESGMSDIKDKIKMSIASLIDSGTHISVASATENIAKSLGLSERLVQYTHIELRNKLNETAFKKVPYNERFLFLPHCLRNVKECPAKYNEEGLQCELCGKCKLDELVRYAQKLGYKRVIIAPGGSVVMNLIKKHRPKAIVGVSCYDEANMALDKLRGSGIAAQAILLTRTGCINTDVIVEEVKEKMALIDGDAAKQTKKEEK